VLAVLAACAGRLVMVGGVDAAILLLVVARFSVAAGGVYQQRFCSGVDFRATAALQNAACVGPVVVLAALTPWTVTDPWKAVGAVATVVLLNATLCMTLYVRAVNIYGAAAVAMLFAVIPAVAGLSPASGRGTPRLNARVSRQQRQDDPGRDSRGQEGVKAVHQSPVTG
jgi:drug/metabolite transporter (DMT)-like permease